ncbi:MAG: GntR family transcriptional regulator [Streptosporangiaceae bacterium]
MSTSCYEQIRADILAGRFEAGAALLETVMAGQYGVSRTPVREALARLEQDGLLRRVIRGYQVCSGTAEDVLEIYEARIALESGAAFAAARRRTDLDLARLRHLHGGVSATRDSHSEWHVALWRAAHNATIEFLLTSLTTRLRIYDSGSRPPADETAAAAEIEASQAEHDKVLAAIVAQDAPAARDALAAHLERSRDLRLAAFARG